MYKSLPFTMYTIPAFTIYKTQIGTALVPLCCKSLTTNGFRRQARRKSLTIKGLRHLALYHNRASLSSLKFNLFFALSSQEAVE